MKKRGYNKPSPKAKEGAKRFFLKKLFINVFLLTLVVVILIMSFDNVNAVSYCVSTSGSDSNDGDCTNSDCSDAVGSESGVCWQTVQKTDNGPYNPGDKILFKRGDTWRPTDSGSVFSLRFAAPSSGNITDPITIGAFGSGLNPLIDASQNVSGFVLATCDSSNDCYNTTLASGFTTQQVFFNGTRLNITTPCPGNITDGTFCQDGTSLLIRLPSHADPDDYVIDASRHDFIFLLNGKSDIVFENLNLTKSNEKLIFTNIVGSIRITVNNTELSWSDFMGAQIKSNLSMVFNNSVHDNRESGLSFNQAINITVRNNRVYNNGQFEAGGGIGFFCTTTLCSDSIIQNNTVYGNYGSGISVTGAPNIIVENNSVYGEFVDIGGGGAAIAFFDNTDDAIIRYNTLYENSIAGIRLDNVNIATFDGGPLRTKIYNNLIYGNLDPGVGSLYAGIILEVDARDAEVYSNTVYNNSGFCLQVGASDALITNDETLNATFRNNICYKNSYGANSYYGRELRIRPEASDRLNHSDYNLIAPLSGNNVSIWNGTDYETLADHQAISNQDNNTIQGDPLFVNVSARDFHLKSVCGTWNGTAFVSYDEYSPAIDKGDPAYDYSTESGSGNRLNIGRYGNTTEASKSCLSPAIFSGSTTNLSSVNVTNIANLVIEDTNYGKISFTQTINISDGADMNTHVSISDNYISINSAALPALNKSATVTLYGLSFTNPRVLKDGSVCPASICTEVSYTGGNFAFDVTQFSAYSAEETPVAQGGGGGVWTQTYTVSDEELEKGYTRELSKKQRLKLNINSETHYVGIIDLTNTTATINITSDPVQVILGIGEEAKVDVVNDSFYDLFVRLNDIITQKANLTIQSIREEIPEGGEGVVVSIVEEKSNFWLWLVFGVAIVIVMIIIIRKKEKEDRY